MATRGFENWTEADVAAHTARIKAGTTNSVGMTQTTAPADQSLLEAPRPVLSPTVHRGHKYRAEPCIVTPDLTLFRRADIEALEATREAVTLRLELDKGTGPLKRRFEAIGIFGEWFGSTKEGRRYIELRQFETAGAIRFLETQVPYECCINGVTIGEFRADFVYEEYVPTLDVWVQQIIDVKGVKTPLYSWKKKHVEAQYSISITEF